MHGSGDILEEVRQNLREGKVQEAMALAHQRETREIHDPNLHIEWADLCEEIGLVDDAIMELNLAIRDRPEDVEILRRLAEIHRDNGNLEKAVRKWRKIIEIQPERAEHYRSLGEVLEEIKDYSGAAMAYRMGIERTGDLSLKAHLKALEFISDEVNEITEAKENEYDWIPSDSQVVRFMDLFSGREGVYARQWVSPTGESGYTPIHEPFTMGVAKNHIMGNITVGLYPLRMDNTVCFIAFDIDIAKFFFTKAITSKKLWDRADSSAQSFACKIADLGAAHQIPIYIEDSGFKGRHCWIFLETPIPARIARRFALLLLQQAGRPPSELQVEAFPKQAFVADGRLGNLIKIPLGIHRRSGRRGLFVDGAGRAIPNQLGFLDKIEKASRKTIYEFIQRFQVAEPSKIEEKEKEETPWAEGEEEIKKPALPAVPEEYDLERDKELQYLLSRCPVLLAIVEKINKEGEIDNEERIVLTYSVGLLKHGPEAVNILLGRCANVDASLFLKSRLRGNPISCPKIRSRVPAITSRVVCNCKFDPKTNLYPTPLIHVQDLEKVATCSLIGQTVDSLQFQQMLQEYLKAKRQMRELEILMKVYEERLDEFFTQAGIDSVQTQLGTLRRMIKEGEEKASYHLEI